MEILGLQLAERAPVLMLVLARMIGLTMTFPAFAAPWFPPAGRIALALGLAGAVLPAIAAGPVPGGLALAILVLGELAVGMAAGFTGQLFFAAAATAGGLLDLEMGFGLSRVFDPSSGSSETVVSRLYHMLAVFSFFVLDGHLLMLSAVAGNLQRVPPGGIIDGAPAALALVDAFGSVLELAVQLAFPVYAALLISTAVLLVLARAAPALNLFAVGFNVKIPVALGLLLLALPFTGFTLQRLILASQAFLDQLFWLLGSPG